MKSSMIRPVRTEAGLGNPLNFTQTTLRQQILWSNIVGILILKSLIFIGLVKDFIETQYRDEDRAVFRKGPYRLRKGFEHFLVNDLKWSKMTAVQRLNKVKELKKAYKRSRKDYVTITAPAPQFSALSDILLLLSLMIYFNLAYNK